MSVYRPSGVTVIAIVFVIIAAIGIISGGLLVFYIPMSQNMTIYSAIYNYFYLQSNISLFPPEYAIILLNAAYMNLIISMMNAQSLANMVYWVVAAVVISSAACEITAFGLLSMKKWGYYLAIILGILSIPSIIGLVIVIYLLVSDVKDDFE